MSKVDVGLGLAFGIGIAGCTTAEWGNVATDAWQSVPPAVAEGVASGNWPLAVGAGVAAILGVVYRSALRDFGAASGAKAAGVVRFIFGLFGKKQ